LDQTGSAGQNLIDTLSIELTLVGTQTKELADCCYFSVNPTYSIPYNLLCTLPAIVKLRQTWHFILFLLSFAYCSHVDHDFTNRIPPAGIPLTSDCELLEEPQHAVHQVLSACYFWQSMSILFFTTRTSPGLHAAPE
jgi:hypothetical protein